jgi:hypothetical protein
VAAAKGPPHELGLRPRPFYTPRRQPRRGPGRRHPSARTRPGTAVSRSPCRARHLARGDRPSGPRHHRVARSDQVFRAPTGSPSSRQAPRVRRGRHVQAATKVGRRVHHQRPEKTDIDDGAGLKSASRSALDDCGRADGAADGIYDLEDTAPGVQRQGTGSEPVDSPTTEAGRSMRRTCNAGPVLSHDAVSSWTAAKIAMIAGRNGNPGTELPPTKTRLAASAGQRRPATTGKGRLRCRTAERG